MWTVCKVLFTLSLMQNLVATALHMEVAPVQWLICGTLGYICYTNWHNTAAGRAPRSNGRAPKPLRQRYHEA